MKKEFKVAAIQRQYTENIDLNRENLKKDIIEAANNGSELIVLSELHNTLYFCQCEDTNIFELAETIPGASTDYFSQIAKDLNIVIVLSLFEKRALGIYHNTSVVLEKDGTIAGKYRKMHIPDDPGFYEKFYFTPGDLGFEPIKTSLGKLGVLICWDQWFPEAARIMAQKGAEILIYPTAIGWDLNDTKEEQQRQLDAWITIQRSHSIANGVFVISANRVGIENDPTAILAGTKFWGNSFICGPQGDFLAQAKTDKQTIYATLKEERISSVRNIWPYFRDRRVEFYKDITKIYCE